MSFQSVNDDMPLNKGLRDNQIFYTVDNIESKIPKNFNGDYTFLSGFNNKVITTKLVTNKYGFRSDEFINNDSNYHIVFAGCSETFGVGGALEDTWSKILFNSINKNIDLSGYYSLGVPGIGFQDILSILLDYFDKFKIPDAIFIMFPNLGRTIRWCDKKTANLESGGYYLLTVNDHQKLVKYNYDTNYDWKYYDYNNDFVQFVSNIKIFEKLCRDNNIKLFWSTWDHYFLKLISGHLECFQNFYDLLLTDKDIKIIQENKKELTLRKEDGHFGTIFHTSWANKFYDYFTATSGIINNKEETWQKKVQ